MRINGFKVTRFQFARDRPIGDNLRMRIGRNPEPAHDIVAGRPCGWSVIQHDRVFALTLVPLGMHTIALNPYPFDQPSLTANVIFRRLTQAKFKDSVELQSAYFKTAPQIASFRLVPSAALQ